MLAVGFSYVAFTVLRYIPFSPTFYRAFITKIHWILSKAFFYIYWDDHVIFVFMQFVTFIDLHYVDPSLHFRDKVDLVIVDNLLMYVFIMFAGIWLSMFEYMFILDICGFILCELYLYMVSQWYWLHRRSLGVLLLFQFLKNHLRRTRCKLPMKIC